MNQEPTAAVIVGRTVENYRQCGDQIHADFVLMRCLNCQKDVVVTPAGYAQMRKAEADMGDRCRLSGALCPPCSLRCTPSGSIVTLTTHGAKRLSEDDSAVKVYFTELLRKVDAK